jgi:hypothetical protein
MLTILWLLGDVVLIVVAFPVLLYLLLRIINPLRTALRALVSISGSAQSVTNSLPSGISEISSMAQTAEELAPEATYPRGT